ncbi:hypothetical protein BDR04DRAFT_1163862 [Suillus decipiens]|nr:hypothetical protein BDR04DRAFT_1163862 [Suillus decipiens]
MSSHEEIRRLAVNICRLIEVARDMPVKETFALATQAGRIVTDSMKLAPSVTAIPPILLSCAMELSTCANVGQDSKIELVRIPNWRAMGYDDHRIMRHPLHKKATVWMSGTSATKDVESVKVFGNGIDWQETLRGVVDPGASTSYQSSTEEAVGLHGTSQTAKPRTFGPAKRKLSDGKGKGVERKKEGTEPREDRDQEVATENTQQHCSDNRGRKRRRTSHKFANDVESSDGDLRMNKMDSERSSNKAISTANISGPSTASPLFQSTLEHTDGSSDNDLRMDELMDSERLSNKTIGMANISGPSALKHEKEASVSPKKLSAMEPAETVTEVTSNDCCTPCHKRSLKCIFGYSNKTRNKLSSCEECTRKKQKCFYGKELGTITGAQGGRTRSRAKSRARSPPRTRSPTASGPTSSKVALPSPSKSRQNITMESPRVVTPEIKLLSVSAMPIPEGTPVDSMEGRLVMLEARLAKLNTVIENIGEVRQSKLLSSEPHPISSAILPSADPYSSAKETPAVQAGAVQPSGAGNDVMDFGVGPIDPETSKYKHKDTNAIQLA